MIELALQPGSPSLFVDRQEGAAYRIFADRAVHAEKFGYDAIGSKRGDMGVTFVS